MKKLFLLLAIALFLMACTTITYHSDGTVTDIKVKRLPFVKADAVTSEVALGVDTSGELLKALVELNNLYSKSQIPVSAIAVPKAEAQATPPPAEKANK